MDDGLTPDDDPAKEPASSRVIPDMSVGASKDGSPVQSPLIASSKPEDLPRPDLASRSEFVGFPQGSDPNSCAKQITFLRRLVHDMKSASFSVTELALCFREDMAATGLDLPEDLDTMVELIVRNGERMKAMLLGLTQFAHASDRHPEPGEWSLFQILQSMNVPAERCAIDLVAPGVVLPMGHQDVQDILECGIENAIRFCDKEPPHIALMAGVGPREWWVEMQDNGPGPPTDDTEALFQPLARAAVAGRQPGVGLGLATVANIANRYGAEASLSAAEQGAVLRVSGPL